MSNELPCYCARIKEKRTTELFSEILKKLKRDRLYRDPNYSAKQLAADINTNTRYLAATIHTKTGGNFNTLINNLRLLDAKRMLQSCKYQKLSLEEIALYSGFSSRQSFYRAFYKAYQTTPKQYRSSTSETEDTDEIIFDATPINQ